MVKSMTELLRFFARRESSESSETSNRNERQPEDPH
jgi:hypothetical protein